MVEQLLLFSWVLHLPLFSRQQGHGLLQEVSLQENGWGTFQAKGSCFLVLQVPRHPRYSILPSLTQLEWDQGRQTMDLHYSFSKLVNIQGHHLQSPLLLQPVVRLLRLPYQCFPLQDCSVMTILNQMVDKVVLTWWLSIAIKTCRCCCQEMTSWTARYSIWRKSFLIIPWIKLLLKLKGM